MAPPALVKTLALLRVVFVLLYVYAISVDVYLFSQASRILKISNYPLKYLWIIIYPTQCRVGTVQGENLLLWGLFSKRVFGACMVLV